MTTVDTLTVREDQDEPGVFCPMCRSGELSLLGCLGDLMHLRCVRCGADSSAPAGLFVMSSVRDGWDEARHNIEPAIVKDNLETAD